MERFLAAAVAVRMQLPAFLMAVPGCPSVDPPKRLKPHTQIRAEERAARLR